MKNCYFDVWEFNNIIPLVEINPFVAKKKLEIYIEKYPKDYRGYTCYISTLIKLGKLEEAEKYLNIVQNVFEFNKYNMQEDNIENFKYSFNICKLKLLCYQEKYKELYEYCVNSGQEENDPFKLISIYCQKQMGILNLTRSSNSYLFRQTIEYKESDFLEHIKKHLSDYNKDLDEPNKVIFSNDFPINLIINEIKKIIPSSKKLYPGFFDNMYIFKYNACGKCNGKLSDYFVAKCFNNTADFITIFPSRNGEYLPYVDLNYLNNNISGQKVKRLSQIEKFNAKYKKDD